jgi:hypothetical protein
VPPTLIRPELLLLLLLLLDLTSSLSLSLSSPLWPSLLLLLLHHSLPSGLLGRSVAAVKICPDPLLCSAMSLPQLPSGAPQKQRQHHHGDDGDAHHHDQHPQQPSEPSRQRRRTRHRDDANPTAEPLIRQPSPVAQTGSTRRLQKPQISTPAAGVGASVGAGVQPVRDGRYSMPRRRSLRLTKERLDNPNDMDGPAPARNSRGRNPKRSSPEVGSLGARPGRQFTVGNIGNNGLIYLRCVLPRT